MRNLKRSAVRCLCLIPVLAFSAAVPAAIAEESASAGSSQKKWAAPWSDSNFFPIAVWLQEPANAARFHNAGINAYVGLWEGPTEEQLAALKKSDMRVICEQNKVALRHLSDPTIIGWMHGDEPDNAQDLPGGIGHGPPVAPEKVITDYHRIQTADPSRPVMLNLGQGVAWDGWYGRGARGHHPEDYPEYVKGCDIASFDIYPVNHDRKEVSNNLWFIANGVKRLVQWTGGQKPVWNCIECTRIGKVDRKPTPQQVRCEVWMSLIHGSRGLIYFVHQFKPKFREAALLDDSEMLAAVTALNRQITQLAPVLNSPSITNAATAQTDNAAVPVALMAKRQPGATYLFAVAMREGIASATFTLSGIKGESRVEVLGENRTLTARDGAFKDQFSPWDAHLYVLRQLP